MTVYKLVTPEFDEHAISVTCACHSAEHNLQLAYYDDADDWELFVSVHLVSRGLLSRLWTAIRYVFGYRCRYGEWEELLIGTRDAREVIEFLQAYLDKRKQS